MKLENSTQILMIDETQSYMDRTLKFSVVVTGPNALIVLGVPMKNKTRMLCFQIARNPEWRISPRMSYV